MVVMQYLDVECPPLALERSTAGHIGHKHT